MISDLVIYDGRLGILTGKPTANDDYLALRMFGNGGEPFVRRDCIKYVDLPVKDEEVTNKQKEASSG